MKKLLIYIKDFRRECILAPLFKLLEASFELIVPLIMAAIIDRGELFGMPAVNLSFVLPLICFAVVALYGFRTRELKA